MKNSTKACLSFLAGSHPSTKIAFSRLYSVSGVISTARAARACHSVPSPFLLSLSFPQKRYISSSNKNDDMPPGEVPSTYATPEQVLQQFEAALGVKPGDITALIGKTKILLDLRRFDEALKAVNEVFATDSQHPEALYLKAEALNRLGKIDDAMEAAKAACEMGPKNDSAHRLHGILLATKGDFKAALSQLNTAARLGPKAAETHFERGRVLHHMKDYRPAIAAYDKAISLNPNFLDAYNSKAVSLTEMREFDEALKTWDESLKIDNSNTALWANRGKLLHRIKKYKEAAESFVNAIKYEDTNKIDKTLRIALGECYLNLNDYENAANSLKQAVAITPDDATAHALLGQALSSWGHLKEGLSELEKACELTKIPQLAWVHTRGNILYRMGKDKQAVELLQKAVEENEHSPILANTYALLGRIYYQGLRQTDEAMKSLDKAIEKDPELRDSYLFKAFVLDELGKHEEALGNWDKAVSLNPDDATVHDNRGKCLSRLKRYDEAEKAFDAAIAVKPDEVEGYKAKGVCLWMQGKQKEAFQSWTKGAEMAGAEDVYIHYLRAMYLKQLGEFKEALDALTVAAKIGRDQGAVPLEVEELKESILKDMASARKR